MKYVLLFFLILPYIGFCQINNTQINGANEININSGNVTIAKLIVTTDPESRLFFKSFIQSIDTTKNHMGQYKTVFVLLPPEGAITSKIITLIFNKPVLSCDFRPVGSGGGMVSYGSNKEKTGFRFVIGQYQCNECQFIIYSTNKIFTKIDGLTGQATQ